MGVGFLFTIQTPFQQSWFVEHDFANCILNKKLSSVAEIFVFVSWKISFDQEYEQGDLESFYLNSIMQLKNFVGLKEQLEVCLTCSRLLAEIQMLLLFQKLRCSNNKMTLE